MLSRSLAFVTGIVAALAMPGLVLANGGDGHVHVGAVHVPAAVAWGGGVVGGLFVLMFVLAWARHNVGGKNTRRPATWADEAEDEKGEN